MLIFGANGQWNCIKGFEKREDKNRRVETQYARNKTIHINHAYAIRRADIYSDLRETRSKRNHKNEVTKNEVTKYSTTKKDMQLDNKQQCMDSLRSFFCRQKNSQSHGGSSSIGVYIRLRRRKKVPGFWIRFQSNWHSNFSSKTGKGF